MLQGGDGGLVCAPVYSPQLYRRRVDVYVGNMGLVHAWAGLKSKSEELPNVLCELSLFCVDHRLSLSLLWVSTKVNPTDAPSRVLDRSDAMLSPTLRAGLWSVCGPFALDLLALPSNAFRPPSGAPLPFFSRDPFPSSSETNVFAQRPPSGRFCFCLTQCFVLSGNSPGPRPCAWSSVASLVPPSRGLCGHAVPWGLRGAMTYLSFMLV